MTDYRNSPIYRIPIKMQPIEPLPPGYTDCSACWKAFPEADGTEIDDFLLCPDCVAEGVDPRKPLLGLLFGPDDEDDE